MNQISKQHLLLP
ncbi:hypothetical protein B4U80_04169 [Leptotrombidium deliense]|uniref:Uncharacterized protein n=1 Tax=Leptotrombidium deliense TaxID=299467 RepID=A0A443QJZ5_9ACAR|nr:hypothetical protein B4U80_04169 [Leptotrombidium deliense]